MPAIIKTNFCFLLSQGADLNAANPGGTALHYASQCGDVPTMSQLLDKGIDINKKTRDGSTALMIASKKGNEAAVDFLLSYLEGRYNNHYTHTL